MSSSKIMHGIVGAVAVGLIGVHTLPNLYPGQILRGHGVPEVEIPSLVQSAFEEVAKKMDIKNREKVQLFINNGYGTLSVGSTWLPGGAAIGVSKTFLYKNCEELENSDITFKGRKVDWQSNSGQCLCEAILFEEEELKFMLAHELSHMKSWDFTTNCFLPAWWLYFTFRAIPIIISVVSFVNPLMKFTIQSCMWLVSYYCYVQQNIGLHQKRELLADRSAAMVDLAYMNGGISVTLKRLKMNTILRKLTGVEGARLYSIEGNDLKDWAHPKLTSRLCKLQELYAEHYLKNI